MWIKSFQISNFKPFEEIGVHSLDRHMNVVVGQNHSGKTTLLTALAQNLVGAPHKNSRQRRGLPLDPISKIDLDFVVSGEELRDAIFRHNMNLHIPLPPQWGSSSDGRAELDRLLAMQEVTLSLRGVANPGSGLGWHQHKYPSNNLFVAGLSGRPYFAHVTVTEDKSDLHISQFAQGENDNMAQHFISELKSRTYFFNAQRQPKNDFRFGRDRQLASDASNLAEALNILQSNPTEFLRYVSEVRRVIPSIRWISLVPSDQNPQNVEIRIWNVDESTQRDDLTIPLAECGTGVGQVLSILYVVLKLSGSVVIIDEPNSFLHPRAAKELIKIFREDQSNQYIISTHSPEIISSIDPDRFFSLIFEDEHTSIRDISREDFVSTKQVLAEIGSQLSDVFGADKILWVEGPTERECFPILYSVERGRLPPGVVIASLRSTGDLEGRHGEVVADIYRNLSSTHVILPTALAVILDGDKREMSVKAIERAFGATIKFLERRCYENYLIHPGAIAAILNKTTTFKDKPISKSKINEWLDTRGSDPKFKVPSVELRSDQWIKEVDAPALLEAMFQELSESREIYRKPLHSVLLTRWLADNEPSYLGELTALVVATLS